MSAKELIYFENFHFGKKEEYFNKGSLLKKKEFFRRKIKTANFSISKSLICAEAANVGYYGC
jgi:hypothetical protein